MLNLPVVATNINNLTDARYFAAFGVDWIGFNVNPAHVDFVDLEALNEILSWVEGPRYFLQDIEWQPELDKILLDERINLDGLFTDNIGFINRYKDDFKIIGSNIDVESDFYIVDELSEKITDIQKSKTYIHYKSDLSLVNQLLESNNGMGIAVTGEREKEAGLKSFEDLDEVFDLLY